ncbi:MAG: hypothetical protein M3Y33_22565, partial [Actinomycetota bacterium]|nr:hypothetical protein [Actinomycetota bacterium]
MVANPVVARPVAAKHTGSDAVAASAAVPSAGLSGPRPARPGPDAGWGWLRRAAEMATQAGSLSAARVGVRYAGEPGWPCYPRIAMRSPGTEPGA